MISPTNNNRENVTEEKLTLLFQQYQAGSVEAFNGLYVSLCEHAFQFWL